MCFLCLLSSSRWPSGYPARCSEECTDKLRSGSYIPLNPLSASPIFVTVFVALRIHKKDFCWQTFFLGGGDIFGGFFSETTMKTVRGVENHWLKKTKHAQCWPQGETFEACRVQMDSLAQHVLSNFERLRQVLVLCLIIFLSKRWQYFSGKTKLSLICAIWGSPIKPTALEEFLQERRKKLKRNLKWLKDNQELRHQVNQLWILYWHGGQGVSI